MARLGTRLIVALLAEWLCHKLDPAWRLRRAQRRIFFRVECTTAAAEKSIKDFALVVGEVAQRFAEYAHTQRQG